MILSCPVCHTQFRLQGSTPSGLEGHFRCSACGVAFSVCWPDLVENARPGGSEKVRLPADRVSSGGSEPETLARVGGDRAREGRALPAPVAETGKSTAAEDLPTAYTDMQDAGDSAGDNILLSDFDRGVPKGSQSPSAPTTGAQPALFGVSVRLPAWAWWEKDPFHWEQLTIHFISGEGCVLDALPEKAKRGDYVWVRLSLPARKGALEVRSLVTQVDPFLHVRFVDLPPDHQDFITHFVSEQMRVDLQRRFETHSSHYPRG